MVVTRRPLPEHDPTIDLLGESDRAFIARQWLGRSGAEADSTRAFAWIASVCAKLGASEIAELARRAADDELRHGEICRRVALAYGSADAPPSHSDERVDLRVPDNLELSVALYIIESSCLSETIGAVAIEACLAASTAPLATAALRELLADEVHHARLGWAYLAVPHHGGLHAAAIAEWLPRLLEDMYAYWGALAGGPTPAAALAHGCLPRERVDELVTIAFEDIALPGFAHVGIDTRAAADYLSKR
jgi:hypothetical protein